VINIRTLPRPDPCSCLPVVRAIALVFYFSMAVGVPARAQLSERTNNESRGSTNTFTITINSTHGVQTSASRTPDFKVETFGSLIVGPESTSIQTNNDGAAGYMKTSGGVGEGQTVGVSGLQRVNFGEGTRYEVKITPKTDDEICPPGATDCKIPEIGNANASSFGSTSTSITVTSSESSFVNTFIRSFTAN
jgi:hypothetical protein